jgi:hypothetical protein
MNRIALIAGALAGLVLALAAGGLLGHRAAPEPVATQVVKVGPASLVVPRAWRPVSSTASAAILETAPGQRAVVKLGAVRTPADSARATMLAGYRAWSEGTVTVLPTSTGVVTVECATCTDAIQTVTVRGAAILDPTPDLGLALRAPDIVATLDKVRVRGRDELRQATTPADQSHWARTLAAAHATAAEALRSVAGPELVERFSDVRGAYADLADAATAGSAADFDAARARIDTAETKLTRSLGDIAPPPVQPAAAAPAPVVSHEVSGPLLVLVITVFAGLGAGLALSSGRRRAESAPAESATPPPPFPWLSTLKSAALERPRPERASWLARAVPATAQPAASPHAERRARAGKSAAPARSARKAAPMARHSVAKRPETKQPAASDPIAQRPPASERAPQSDPVSERPAAERPAASAPKTERPPLSEPLSERPVATDPETERPPLSEPVSERPATKRPTAKRPATKRPAAKRPATKRPAAKRPTAKRPATERPTTERPAAKRPTTERPAAKRPTTKRPATKRPATEQPATEQPATEQPATKQPATKQPATKQPAAERPAAERPAAERPAAERPAPSDPKTERPPLRAPVLEGPVASDPVPKRRVASDPVPKRPVPKRPVASDPVAKRPVASDPVAKRPVASDPVAKRPAASDPVPKRPAASDPVAKRRAASGSVAGRSPVSDPVAVAKARAAKRPARRPNAPVPPRTKWTCELAWSANLLRAGFRAQACAPGARPVEVARSRKVNWPPLIPPTPQADVVAAARSVAKALVEAGWTPTSKGSDWYAQRFAWTRDDAPPTLGTIAR